MGEKTATDVLEPKSVVRHPSDIEPGIGEEGKTRKERGRAGECTDSKGLFLFYFVYLMNAIVAALTKLRIAAKLFGLSVNVVDRGCMESVSPLSTRKK